MVFVCLWVYFVSGVIYVLYVWIWTLTTQLQTNPSLNSYKVLGILTKDHLLTVLYLALLENKGTLTSVGNWNLLQRVASQGLHYCGIVYNLVHVRIGFPD